MVLLGPPPDVEVHPNRGGHLWTGKTGVVTESFGVYRGRTCYRVRLDHDLEEAADYGWKINDFLIAEDNLQAIFAKPHEIDAAIQSIQTSIQNRQNRNARR